MEVGARHAYFETGSALKGRLCSGKTEREVPPTDSGKRDCNREETFKELPALIPSPKPSWQILFKNVLSD